MPKSEHVYDLFVSYAEADRAWVEGYLLDALTRAGVRCHSEAAFALGVPRLLEFERAVRHSQRILLVLSPATLAEGFNQFTDLLAQSYGLEIATWPVIPLILHPVKLPPRLAMLTALDATDPAEWPAVMERLCAELQRPVPGPAPRPPCPYPGMVPFGEADSDRFFGRDREVQELLERLGLHQFVTIIGPSGSGKSSLVFAGLIPALRMSSFFGPGEWLVRALRPGAAPLAALAAALDGDAADPAQAVSRLLAAQPEPRRLLLVVDQFEELFTLAHSDLVPFQRAILDLARTSNCYVILVVRADFYPELMAGPLWPEIQAHRVEMTPLDEDGLRQAVVRPAETVGVYVEAELVERLLADAGGEPGVLPLLQETLVLLWERVEGRFLPLSAYEALGDYGRTGLQVAVAQRAEAALSGLTLEQQAIARRIFLRLLQFGEGRADTRRQQLIAALRSAGDDPALFDQTLRHLTDNRLLILSMEEDGADIKAEIAHEALINGWPTLRGWLDERREAEQTRRRLEAKAAEWARLGRGSGGLLDQVTLLEAERWLASPDASDLGYGEALLALVQASQAAVERAQRGDDAVRQMAREALFSEDHDLRMRSVSTLANMADPQAVQLLLEALEQQSPSRGLGRLLGGRQRQQKAEMRQTIAEALGEMGDPQAVEPLIAQLQDPEPGPRQAAAQALGKIGDARARDALETTAARDADRQVREAAGIDSLHRALGLAEALRRHLGHDLLSTKHLLWGLYQEPSGAARALLTTFADHDEIAPALRDLAGAPVEAADLAPVPDDALERIAMTPYCQQAMEEAARLSQTRALGQPIITLEVQLDKGLVLRDWSRLQFVVRNEGYGPARNLTIRASGDAFEGQVVTTRRIITLRAGQERAEWLDVRPLEYGGTVPLRVSVEYQDQAGELQSRDHTIYIPVARTPVARTGLTREEGETIGVFGSSRGAKKLTENGVIPDHHVLAGLLAVPDSPATQWIAATLGLTRDQLEAVAKSWQGQEDPQALSGLARRARNTYVLVIGLRPREVTVGQRLYLRAELVPGMPGSRDSFELPDGVTKLYCFIADASGLHVVGSAADSIPLTLLGDKPLRASFELQARLHGPRSYTIELFREHPDKGGEPIVQVSGQAMVAVPEAGEPIPPMLPVLDIQVAPRPDFVLLVETALPHGDGGPHHLTYRLTSRLPSLRCDNEEVGQVTLHPADLDNIRALVHGTVRSAIGVQPEDTRARMVSLGRYLFDRLFPPAQAAAFRQALWQAQGFWQKRERLGQLPPTWLIVEEGITWLPWELVVPYRVDSNGPAAPRGERYRLSRWGEGLGRPWYGEVPLGDIVLAHYKVLEREQAEQDEELLAWSRVLNTRSIANSILPVVKPDERYYGLHLLRHADHIRRERDIEARDGKTRRVSPEDEARRGRLDLRLRRPVITLAILSRESPPQDISADEWLLPERILPFLRAGASAVLGPWWPTCEAADREFWSTFYGLLAARVGLGEAVWWARQAVQRRLPDRPDWLAYTLFGDPRARPYVPETSEGYTALECLNPEEDGHTLRPGRTYTFRASIQRRPPVWYQDRLVETELLPNQAWARFLPLGLQEPRRVEMVPDQGGTILEATMELSPPTPGDFLLMVQLFEGEELLTTLQLTLEVRDVPSGGYDG